MYKLPHWVLPDKFPAFYESESATVLEMTAKLYKSMSDLVDEYNKFADDVNKDIEMFMSSTTQNLENFKSALQEEFQDFINDVENRIGEPRFTRLENELKAKIDGYYNDVLNAISRQDNTINERLTAQDNKIQNSINNQNTIIQEAKNYMQTNISETTQTIIQEIYENGGIGFVLDYNVEGEELTFASALDGSGVLY